MFVVNLWEADAAVRIATYHPPANETRFESQRKIHGNFGINCFEHGENGGAPTLVCRKQNVFCSAVFVH